MGGGAKMEGWDRGEPSHPLRREESEAGQRRLQELLQETVQKEVKTQRCAQAWLTRKAPELCRTMNRSSFCSHRGGDEKKDKGGEKTPENQNSGEHDAVKTSKHLEMNHSTAVWMPHTHVKASNLTLFFFAFVWMKLKVKKHKGCFACHHCNNEDLCKPKGSVFSSDNQLLWSA